METESKDTRNIKAEGNISRNHYLWVIGFLTLAGVVGGYLYYALVGCNIEGGCAIKSNPYLMMIWGGAMGYLIPDIFLKPRKDERVQTSDK